MFGDGGSGGRARREPRRRALGEGGAGGRHLPRFLVVVPCYNAEATLGATLQSVAAQSFRDFQVVVVDDGSRDGSAEIALAFERRDARFRLVQLANGGPSRARNIGVLQGTPAPLIAFLDSDDLWAPQKLMRMAECFAEPAAPDAIYGRVAFFRGRHDDARTLSSVRGEPLGVADLLRENAVCTMSNLVVRRDRFIASGGFRTDLVHGEDVDFLVRLAAAGARIEGVEDVLVHYRTSEGGLSSDLDAMRGGWQAARAAAEAAGVVLDPAEIRAAEAVHLRYLARRALRLEAGRATAFRLALEGLALSPAGFFDDARRGALTLAGALAGLAMPAAARRRIFS